MTKDKRKRSPNHPAVNLEQAIKRAEELFRHDNTHQVPIDLLHERWGGLAKMGGYLLQLVAALKAYGLLELEGQKENRKIRVSPLAVKIIENHPERESFIQQAALEPHIYSEIWNRYKGVGLPKEDVLDRSLRWGEEFLDFRFENKEARELLIKNFTETIKFAKLDPNAEVKPPTIGEGEIAEPQNNVPIMDQGQMNQPSDVLKPPAFSQEFATIQIPDIGILKIVYPLTKKKLNIIKNILSAIDDDLKPESK